jgi:hypothetical protein
VGIDVCKFHVTPQSAPVKFYFYITERYRAAGVAGMIAKFERAGHAMADFKTQSVYS